VTGWGGNNWGVTFTPHVNKKKRQDGHKERGFLVFDNLSRF